MGWSPPTEMWWAIPGDTMRGERRGLGRGEGGIEGETTVMAGAMSMEGTGVGDARRDPGMTGDVALILDGRA